MAKNKVVPKQIIDIGGGTPSITSYWFLGVAVATTLTGYFIDEYGTRISTPQSLTIPLAGTGNPVNLQSITGGCPINAIGFVGTLAGAVYMDVSNESDTEFPAAFNTGYASFPQQQATGNFAIGRVSSLLRGSNSIGADSNSIRPALRPQISVTPVCDTAIMAANDIICDVTRIPNACWAIDQPAFLEGVTIFDQDDNTAIQLKLAIMNSNTSIGTVNNAPNISDANGLEIIKLIDIPAADWYDWGGFKRVDVAVSSLPRQLWPKAGTRDIYFALLVGAAGTPTYTASGIKTIWEFQDALRGA